MSRSFDGTYANHLQIGDVAALDISGTALSMHALVKPSVVTGTRPIFAKWASGAQAYIMFITASKLTAYTGNGVSTIDGPCTGATTLSTGVWYGTGVRKSGTGASALQVLLNGAVDGSVAGPTTLAGNAEIARIGADGFGASVFNGLIAEAAVWNVALTDAEFAALAKGVSPLRVHPGNLKGYWPLWGVAYPEIDLSSNGNNAAQGGTVLAANHSPSGPLVLA